MNWFLYVGGGFIWTMFTIGFMRVFYKKENFNIAVITTWWIAYLLIWIWMCWKISVYFGG